MTHPLTDTARKLIDGISEESWQEQIITYAQLNGWLVYHTRDSRRSAAGYPDLTLVREHVIFAELKREKGTVSPDQRVWLSKLAAAGAETYVWRPSDWDQVAEILKRPRG
jgi:hypothetical protein